MRDGIRYGQIANFVLSTPWAILPEKLGEIMAFLSAKAAGDVIDAEMLAEYQAASSRQKSPAAVGDVAVLPVFGTISNRMNLMTSFSGGTSVESLIRDVRDAVKDPDIRAIVLDVDSPGGTVDGITELASEIYAARRSKPVTAVANTLMASAAYWIASAASEIAVTPSALVGSIGVIAAHEDRSGFYDQMGVDVSLVTAGKYKAENNPFEALTDEGKAEIQKRVDEYYGMFTRDVAKGRSVSVDTVRGGMGEGRVVGAREAIRLGMADRIATRDEVIATIGRQQDVVQDGMSEPTAQTFENEAETALTAVRSFQARVEALTALREGRNTPVSQTRVPLLMEHRDAYRALADDYDALVVACRTDSADLAMRRMARARLHDLDIWLIEN